MGSEEEIYVTFVMSLNQDYLSETILDCEARINLLVQYFSFITMSRQVRISKLIPVKSGS